MNADMTSRIKRILFSLFLCLLITGCGGDREVSGSFSEEIIPNALPETERSLAAPEPELLPEESVKVKGIYVTGPRAGSEAFGELLDMVRRTELNTMVIDIKNDEGRIVYQMESPIVREIGASIKYIQDMPALIQTCKENDIYLIARIVAFKDPYLAEKIPEWSLHTSDGSLFRDKSGMAWVNPYRREVWNYLMEIAEQAVRIGFDEIQFDYIRFSTDPEMKRVVFGPESNTLSKEDIILEFTEYAAGKCREWGVPVSADVYGVIMNSPADAAIVGQNYMKMAEKLDYISPMVYPSHYGPGNLGLDVPDAQPYDAILRSMSLSKQALAVSGNSVSGNAGESGTAVVRPWLQDFTAKWVAGHIPYGPEQIRQQIQAVYDAGYEEWILWNASNHYTEEGLLIEE